MEKNIRLLAVDIIRNAYTDYKANPTENNGKFYFNNKRITENGYYKLLHNKETARQFLTDKNKVGCYLSLLDISPDWFIQKLALKGVI